MSDPAHLPPERLNGINRLTVVAKLLSSAVHDTRNALQIVTGHAELFADSTGDAAKSRERSRSILTQSERATERMHGLVLMAQEADTAPSRFELRAMVEEVIALRKSSFGRARIKVSVQSTAGEFWVRASRPDMVRATANLLLNAERAIIGRQGAEMTFTVSATAKGAQVSVRDNGPGVSADVLPHLFQPFAPSQGAGLGLHVSRWLVQRAGGTLAHTSNEGGAEFTLELPEP